MSEYGDSAAAAVLARAISELSEEQWCAGWYIGVEHILWEADQGWRSVAERLGCWVMWEDGPVRVPLDVWQRLHDEWRSEQGANGTAWIAERGSDFKP